MYDTPTAFDDFADDTDLIHDTTAYAEFERLAWS